ncbi:hypothetical protein OUZ56_005675 [Daphnia magna]|uniref:Uncharacterized protein n=1 Tax=Daphnia magna TaxID=35525 RepID=A0ABQ9YTQ5_9CRUS|nr:hypothetical protein OUZ56_005675 [Daphnia magna]
MDPISLMDELLPSLGYRRPKRPIFLRLGLHFISTKTEAVLRHPIDQRKMIENSVELGEICKHQMCFRYS